MLQFTGKSSNHLVNQKIAAGNCEIIQNSTANIIITTERPWGEDGKNEEEGEK